MITIAFTTKINKLHAVSDVYSKIIQKLPLKYLKIVCMFQYFIQVVSYMMHYTLVKNKYDAIKTE